MSDSDDQPPLFGQMVCPCPGGSVPPDVAGEPAREPVRTRTPRKRPGLLASEETAIHTAWQRVSALGLCGSLSTRKGTLKACAKRTLASVLRRTRQARLFEVPETVEDMLGRIAVARRQRDANRG